MSKLIAILAGALSCAAGLVPMAMAQPTTLPPGANTTDPNAPFFVDLSGLDMRTRPPTRDPLNPRYPLATAIADGQLPPKGAEGNFIIGPSHPAAPETQVQAGVPKGRVITFTMTSSDSSIYHPGIVREDRTADGAAARPSTAPGDPSNVIITTGRPGVWSRTVWVYVPQQYKRGSAAPFMVASAGDATFFTVLDNLIAQRRIPTIIAVAIGPGGQDGQGSERGVEFDTVSGTFAQWIESEVLPLVEKNAGVSLTHDPEGRAAMGGSSSGVAAFTMAWFRPDLYRRVLAYSPTFVNQQWPHNPALPGGAWEYHSPWPGPARPGPNLMTTGYNPPVATDTPPGLPLIPNTPARPIRMWFEVGDRDIFYGGLTPDGMHDWVLASENMARALAAKGYHYQFVFARNAGHVDGPTRAQTLPSALEWVWQGYSPARKSPR